MTATIEPEYIRITDPAHVFHGHAGRLERERADGKLQIVLDDIGASAVIDRAQGVRIGSYPMAGSIATTLDDVTLDDLLRERAS